MTVVLDEEGCRMWIDDFSPFLFIKFGVMPAGKPPSKLFEKKCKKAWHQLTDKFDCVYSVIDASDCTNTCLIELLNYCFDHFPAVNANELKYFAVVTPGGVNPVVETHLSLMIAQRTHAGGGCFMDFFDALGQLNRMRQQTA